MSSAALVLVTCIILLVTVATRDTEIYARWDTSKKNYI